MSDGARHARRVAPASHCGAAHDERPRVHGAPRGACPDCLVAKRGLLTSILGAGDAPRLLSSLILEARAEVPPSWFEHYAFGVVRRGIVVRQRVDAHGDRIAVDAAGPGCLLPLRMALGAEASAGYAASRLVVCVYPHEDLESELASPATLRDLFELQRHALNRLERIAAARGCAAAVDQVESLLEALLESIAPLREGDPRPVDLTQRDMAALLRLRPETVCRALRTLQDRGRVTRSADGWTVAREG